jgi:hypothetical protein
MINSITITNHLSESITLDLRFPERSGFLVREITGLGPTKANINATELSTTDGSMFNSARLTARNIVLSLVLLPNPTIELTRRDSYRYFPVKKRVLLTIETDTRTCSIYGYIESNEPNIFSNQVSTQISILCPNPYFYSTGNLENTITVFSGLTPAFTFPFSNESISENLISFGEVIVNQEKNIYYSGDSEIGLMIYIHAIGAVTNLTVYNAITSEIMKIDTTKLATLTGFGIIEGDDIVISTVKGNKYIELLRDGVYINILNCLDRDTQWFQLAKGDNLFGFMADVGEANIQARIENQTVYEGV